MYNPFISFIALSYNHAAFLLETLESIKNQKAEVDYEIIITDDGSKDNSVELISNWVENNQEKFKVKKLINKTNEGLCKTLNKAIQMANGKWIKLIACDDIIEENYVEEVLKIIYSYDEVGLIITDMSHINQKGEKIRDSNWEYSQTRISNEIVNNFDNLLRSQYLNAPTVIYKKELWENIGGYDEGLIYDDWDFLLRAKKKTNFYAIQKSLVRYRMHGNNMHLNFKTNAKYVTDSIIVLKKHLNDETKPIIREKVIEEISNLIPIDENEALRIWEQEITWLKSEEKNQPLVSVLLPVYNAEKYLENALKSILFQTYSNLEVIVVNDGSTDNSASIINSFVQTNNVKYYINPENFGISKTRNIALSYCNGEYIALLDSDDICAPNRIENQVKFLIKNTGYKAVSSWMQEFDKNTLNLYRYYHDFETLKCVSVFYNPVSHPATMFDSSALKEIGYDESYSYAEDYQMLLRFMQKYKISCLQETLYFNRIHTNQISNSINESLKIKNEKQISQFIIDLYWSKNNKIDVDFYFKNFKKYIEFKDAKDFILWDKILKILMKKSTNNFNNKILVNFVFNNYWFINFKNSFFQFTIIDLIRVLKSPYCVISPLSKFKYFIKKIIFNEH
jgi:glycosyltransferase involved in cell wall biosynthesis